MGQVESIPPAIDVIGRVCYYLWTPTGDINLSTAIIKLDEGQRRLLTEFCFQIDKAMNGMKDLPEKFTLAQEAFGKIVTNEAVNGKEVTGLLDTIGGYVCSLDLLHDKTDSVKERKSLMADMHSIMALARVIENQAKFANFKGLKAVPT